MLAAMFSVRPAKPDDAAALLATLKSLLAETPSNVPLAPDELQLTVSQERDILAEYAVSPRSAMLVADDGTGIIGQLSIKPVSERRALLHIATLGMAVVSAWRGRGVGSALVTAGLEFARGAGYKRVELYVYARNTSAIRLYEKHGFVHEGTRRGYIREGDTYLDDFIMARVE